MAEVEFRQALGHFATGVAIVTTIADEGPVGLTVNSFNSVSLDPPLVLWSLSKSSSSVQAFSESGYFAVHILASDQREVSRIFAQRGADKYAGIPLETGINGTPLLPGCSARFECKTHAQYEGGDHLILVGEVVKYETSEKPPLLFHKGVMHSGDDVLSGIDALAAGKSRSGQQKTDADARGNDV